MTMKPTPLAIDRTIALEVNGSTQPLRMCAERPGLPPLLVVQAGPGLPLLHEVAKFQRRLNLERDFLVSYWEQRGCGPARQRDARSVSLRQQVEDLRVVLHWLRTETRKPIVLLGISLGGTIALQAVEQVGSPAIAVVAISPDSQTAMSDDSANHFLQQQSQRAGDRQLTRKVKTLGNPPYLDLAAFQRRARLLADRGSIERGRTFNGLFRETLISMLRTYGVSGTLKALRNLNVIQRQMLSELASLDLLSHPPRVPIPVHYIFGEKDALTPSAVIEQLPLMVAAPEGTVTVLPGAAHMVHFDAPEAVRSIVMRAMRDAPLTATAPVPSALA
jgi:pimeloyl-ACP methyl ester carboxylesterase